MNSAQIRTNFYKACWLHTTLPLVVVAASILCPHVLAQSAAPSAQSIAPPAEPVVATVTFYSNKVSLLGGLPGARGAAFKGHLFWGDTQLAFMEPGHFVTFALTPGTYRFTAASWITKTPVGGYDLLLTMQGGQHYFLEATSRSLPPPFGLNPIPCEKAEIAAGRNKPLEKVHLSTEGEALVVPETTFPKCS